MLTPQQAAFLKLAIPAAQSCQAETGVPASITIAQACLESGYGQHMPQGSFNCFGIKAATGQPLVMAATTEIGRNGEVQHIQGAFAKYPNLAAGFAAHARLLTQATRYAPAMAVRNNPQLFAGALKACGYSTNPYYPGLLMELVHEFDLDQYDRAATATATVQA